MFAICITGSMCGSGKIPLRPAHSISKLRIRSGAIFDHWPSGACDMNWSHLEESSDQLPLHQLFIHYEPDDQFNLTVRLFRFPFEEGVLPCWHFDPVHTNDLVEIE